MSVRERKTAGRKEGKKEVLIYSTVCYVYTEIMGLSHIFKRDKRIPSSGHWAACRCTSVCVRVRERESVCVNTHVSVGGWGFYLFKICCISDEPLEGFSRLK